MMAFFLLKTHQFNEEQPVYEHVAQSALSMATPLQVLNEPDDITLIVQLWELTWEFQPYPLIQ